MFRLLSNRRYFSLIILSLLVVILIVHIPRSSPVRTIRPINRVENLLRKFFQPSIKFSEQEIIWNELMNIWKTMLLKFLHDGCHLCHTTNIQCLQSIDFNRYIHLMNERFSPNSNKERIQGMGLYDRFDLLFIQTMNNSILFNDKTICDYFHMFQLLIHVQMIFHENQIEYFLTKGTFIGSLRHHDVVPWDTDIDLFISYSSIPILMNSIKLSRNSSQMNNQSKIINSWISRDDLVVYQYRNTHRVTSYKIFSFRSVRISGTQYNWPKIDVFPYHENPTHVFAFPHHRHNLGTMSFFSKTDLYPLVLRPLGPVLLPSPSNLRRAIKAMIRPGQANIFDVCEGNTFLHRQNRASTQTWRLPCRALTSSYPFVKSQRYANRKLCTETLVFNQSIEHPLSSYFYQCIDYLPRTLT